MSVYTRLAPISCITQLSVVSIHSSFFLPPRMSCQDCYTWRTAKATCKARVGLSVLSSISSGYVHCLSLSPLWLITYVCRGQTEVAELESLPLHMCMSIAFAPFLPVGLQISPLFYNLLSVHPHSTCYFALERHYCTVVSSGDCPGYVYITSWSSYVISLCLSFLICKIARICEDYICLHMESIEQE